MKQLRMLAFAGLVSACALTGVAAFSAQPGFPQYGNGQPQGQGYGQNQAGWDTPPPGFTQTQANGYRDGIVAGQDDLSRHVQPNATSRPEYRNPVKMPFLQRVMYRDGFQKGYQLVMDRFYGTQAPPPQYAPVPPPPQYAPVAPPAMPTHEDAMVYRHRGFQEGMDGALRDLDNRRRPDPNNRDEFRNPNVPPGMAEPYRDGFRHGYERGMQALTGGPQGRGPNMELQVRGYHDGAEGAIRDWNNNRRPDPNNRDEYRRPNGVPPNLLETYREGFRHGYERVATELQGYIGRR